MRGTLGLVTCMILTFVYQSIHITWSIRSHSVYIHPHLSARIYVQSQKNEPPPKLFPQSKYFEFGCMEARALTINSKKTYVRTYTETADMGKYCMLLHSYIHGHCVVINKINNVLLVCSSLDVFCLTFQYVSCHSI